MMVSLRMPEDVVENLKRIAPLKGMSGYQALIKYYVGMGLRRDLEILWLQEVPERIQGILAKHGLSGEVQDELVEELLGIIPHERIMETKETENLQIAPNS
jgi:ATP/maltotriose-dependent transcriptional regulator MalT